MPTPSPSSFSSGHRPVRVLKFGGTSVGAPAPLRQALRIIVDATESCRPVTVVSAAAGATDLLVEAVEGAPHPPAVAEEWAERLGAPYRTLAGEVLDETLRTRYESVLHARLSGVRRALTTRIPDASATRDAVLAVGERLMAPLLAAGLTHAGARAGAVDAASLLRTDASHGAATVDWPETRRQIRSWYARRARNAIPVVTGFIGSTADGTTTTLGRGGSDYSAALVARALDAERLERWTDVDALYTADPKTNGDAQRLAHLSMRQARDWTKDGRLGLHPRTLDPLASVQIPVHVRCIHRPDAPGTRIASTTSEAR